MKLSRILNKAIDYLTEYPKRMCGSSINNGKGVNKLIAPYDISEASTRHQLVLFGKEPLYSDRMFIRSDPKNHYPQRRAYFWNFSLNRSLIDLRPGPIY